MPECRLPFGMRPNRPRKDKAGTERMTGSPSIGTAARPLPDRGTVVHESRPATAVQPALEEHEYLSNERNVTVGVSQVWTFIVPVYREHPAPQPLIRSASLSPFDRTPVEQRPATSVKPVGDMRPGTTSTRRTLSVKACQFARASSGSFLSSSFCPSVSSSHRPRHG